jgi:regulatory protein
VHGEHPPARRRSGRRTRGRRAATGPDLADPDLVGPDLADPGLADPHLVDPDAAGPVPAQPAWSDEWTAGERTRETTGERARGQEQRREQRELDDPEQRARQICLRQLSLAPKTRVQLHDALTKRGIPGDVADSVLSRFADVGLIDDAAFAKAWVESRHYSKGLAGRALKAELRRRGVADDDIKEAVETLDPDAEVETARRLVERKLASTKGQPAETRTRRMAGMLARKGYPAGLAFRVIREALEAEAEADAATGAAAFDETQAFLGDEPPVDPSDDEYVPYTD